MRIDLHLWSSSEVVRKRLRVLYRYLRTTGLGREEARGAVLIALGALTAQIIWGSSGDGRPDTCAPRPEPVVGSADSNFAERAAAHTCHADGCTTHVPPAMFMCRRHWFLLPRSLRDEVWATYVPGQERRMDPSDEYLAAAQRAIDVVAALEGGKVRLGAR